MEDSSKKVPAIEIGGGVTALSHVAVHDDGIVFELPRAIAKFFEGDIDRIGDAARL